MENKKRWENTFDCFFVDYNNGHQKDYEMFKIERQVANFDWKSFINSIRTYTYGCKSKEFQEAMHENNIYYVHVCKYSQERFDNCMDIDFNKKHYKILEHNNIGNY
jgi:hypothetical protein